MSKITKIRIAEVAPDVATQSLNSTYTYEIPDNIQVQIGNAVVVPLGKRLVVGYVVEIRECSERELNFPFENLKPIDSVFDELNLPCELMKLLEKVSEEYLCTIGSVVSAAFPPGSRSRLFEALQTLPIDISQLTPAEVKTYERIIKEGESKTKVLRISNQIVRSLVKKKAIKRVMSIIQDPQERVQFWKLASEDRRLEFIRSEGKRKPAQLAAIKSLEVDTNSLWTLTEIESITKSNRSTLAKLKEAGILLPAVLSREHKPKTPLILTNEQKQASIIINTSIARKDGKFFLLHGVTGSGKTEIYFRAIAEALKRGSQTLFLVPEIALTTYLIAELRGRFGSGVAMFHSGLSDAERFKNWKRAKSGDAPIVLGARNAIFAPLIQTGLIIVDEEHDDSYKSGETPRFNARKLAELRSIESGATLVFGSATPSIETYFRAVKGDFELLTLSKRATKTEVPTIEIVDLRKSYQIGKPSIISHELHRALSEALSKQEQAILFVNRRAYAHSLLCRDCGYVPRCPNCAVSLVFHKSQLRLVCHHCGYTVKAPDVCANCASLRLRPLGLGTERVEQIVKKEFPQARIGRLDRDVAHKKGAIEEIFFALREQQIDILVGTQMVAKGLDFPKVSLVGVITADVGLFIPDYRSTERTFQLLTQVSGRAGRHGPGRVIIQTFQPEHPALRFAAQQNYKDFYNAEIADREEAGYPPFVRLVNIIASSEHSSVASEAIKKIADELTGRDSIVTVGPSVCPISKRQGLFRYHLLVKISPNLPVELAYPKKSLEQTDAKIIIDVDPTSIL